MKKNYTSPAIETTEILVEQGIAQSAFTPFATSGDVFDLSGATWEEENEGAVIW